MNTPSNTMNGASLSSQTIAPVAISATRTIYWSIRRELWENRLIYLAPFAAAVIFVFGFLVNTLHLRYRMHGAWPSDPAQQHDLLALPYEFSGALIMGIALIVGVFYTLEALYGERRDRSILFWKSLPVSDVTTVLSKIAIPLIVIPMSSFAITIVAQFIMLLLSSVVLIGSGANITLLWTQEPIFRASGELFYHMLTVHGLWYAPLYGWLLLVSAWAPRAPFIWAALPPFVICIVEKITFNTWRFAQMLQFRLEGPQSPASTMAAGSMDPMKNLMPHNFFGQPGLWIGLAIAAVFLAATIRLRRYRGPI